MSLYVFIKMTWYFSGSFVTYPCADQMNKKTGLKAGFVFEKDDVKLLEGYRQVSVSFVCFLFFAF